MESILENWLSTIEEKAIEDGIALFELDLLPLENLIHVVTTKRILTNFSLWLKFINLPCFFIKKKSI